MLWRVRTTLSDRPGSLAALARRCGEAEVNILAVQVFPGLGGVIDELVLRAPEEWREEHIEALLRAAGGQDPVVLPCTEAALADQPTRYLQAARSIVEAPMSFPEVAARLFDTVADPYRHPRGHDTMTLRVADVPIQLHRATAFTAVEYARGQALAELVDDVLARDRDGARPVPVPEHGDTPRYRVDGATVVASVGGLGVGTAELLPAPQQPRPVELWVEPAWRRRGVGTRLLAEACRLAQQDGADEVLLTTGAENRAALAMVLATGRRGRIRVTGGELAVRIPVRESARARATSSFES